MTIPLDQEIVKVFQNNLRKEQRDMSPCVYRKLAQYSKEQAVVVQRILSLVRRIRVEIAATSTTSYTASLTRGKC